MYYGDKRESKVNIAHELMNREGWKIYDYSEDRSDSYTDYYHPASWGGIATKNGYTLCVDISKYDLSYSGKEIYMYKYKSEVSNKETQDKINKLQAMINDSTTTEGEKTNSKNLINRLEKKLQEDQETKEKSKVLVDQYPTFQENPKSCNWHIEKDGIILAKGKGAFQFHNLPYQYNIWENKFKEGFTHYTQYNSTREEKTLTESEQKSVNDFKNFILKIENIVKGVAMTGDGTKETELEGLEAESKKGYRKEIVTEYKSEFKPKIIENFDINNLSDSMYFILNTSFTNGCYKGSVYKINHIKENQFNKKIYVDSNALNRKLTKVLTGLATASNRFNCTLDQFKLWIQKGSISICEIEEVKTPYQVEKWIKLDKTRPKKTQEAPKQEKEPEQETKPETTLTESKKSYNENIKVKYNKELNGIEISFTEKPEQNIIDSLKSNGFRWHKYNKYWYAKQSESKNKFAESLTGSTQQETSIDIESADNIIDNLSDIIISLGLNSNEWQYNDLYEQKIKEYITTNNIIITKSIIDYIVNEGLEMLAEFLQALTPTDKTTDKTNKQEDYNQLIVKIGKSIESLQKQIDRLSGNYLTNTYKRMREADSRESKKASLKVDIKILEYVKTKAQNPEMTLTELEKCLTVKSFTDEIHSYYMIKYGRYPKDIEYPYISDRFGEWYNKEVPTKQARLKKANINNTTDLINAVEEYKTILDICDNNIVDPVQEKIRQFTNQYKLQQKGDINFTPDQVVKKLIDYARIDINSVVLEPSAGIGNIADRIKEVTNNLDVCERMTHFQELLKLKGHNVISDSFLDCHNYNHYDSIIMNPPFSNNQDIIHLQHAYKLLKNNGVLVCITSPHWQFANDRNSQEFRNWINNLDYEVEELPSGTFEMTSVSTRIIIIYKDEACQEIAV